VLSILRGLMMAGELRAAQIGVVTPYTAQVSLIRNELQARGRGVLMISASSASAVSNGGHLFWNLQALAGGRAIEVKTVDGFQGREKELIIFSAVRAGRSGSLGFVSDARRLNVAFTRARRGLIVVGEPRTLVWSGGHSH
jgi:regulator of nonsense transcripts 1